ncbi:hypothetical protein PR048_028216 [Dryococelus australis]|uniref:Uncharacterized protein n=1 Tax=Dryococelus australis TaxID=614101 RepID=A0ABQ9GIN3_9NEOP|nr:hypothetical protein PR048_028216 [Dryococelus australis]
MEAITELSCIEETSYRNAGEMLSFLLQHCLYSVTVLCVRRTGDERTRKITVELPGPNRKEGWRPKHVYSWGRGGVVVRLLASNLCEPGLIPGGVAPGFSHVGIVPDDATCRRVSSGISHFPRPFIPALLHAHLASPSSALKTPIEMSAEQRHEARAGKMGDPGENPSTSGIIRHNSYMRKSGGHPPGVELGSPRWEASSLTTMPSRPRLGGIRCRIVDCWTSTEKWSSMHFPKTLSPHPIPSPLSTHPLWNYPTFQEFFAVFVGWSAYRMGARTTDGWIDTWFDSHSAETDYPSTDETQRTTMEDNCGIGNLLLALGIPSRIPRKENALIPSNIPERIHLYRTVEMISGMVDTREANRPAKESSSNPPAQTCFLRHSSKTHRPTQSSQQANDLRRSFCQQLVRTEGHSDLHHQPIAGKCMMHTATSTTATSRIPRGRRPTTPNIAQPSWRRATLHLIPALGKRQSDPHRS